MGVVIYQDDRIIASVDLEGKIRIKNANNHDTEVCISYVYSQGLTVESKGVMTPSGENSMYIHPFTIGDCYKEEMG